MITYFNKNKNKTNRTEELSVGKIKWDQQFR